MQKITVNIITFSPDRSFHHSHVSIFLSCSFLLCNNFFLMLGSIKEIKTKQNKMTL